MTTHAHTLSPTHRLHMPLGARQRPLEAIDAPTMRLRLEALLEAAQGGLLAKFDLVDYTDSPLIQIIETLLQAPATFPGEAFAEPGATIVVRLSDPYGYELMMEMYVWSSKAEGVVIDDWISSEDEPLRLHRILATCAAMRREGKMGRLPPLHVPLSAPLVHYLLSAPR